MFEVNAGENVDWLENKLKDWSIGPGSTEQKMCESAEQVIRNAIKSHSRLSNMGISIFTKGSFKNRTNIPSASDVDVCIRLNDVFFADYPQGKSAIDFGYGSGSITFDEFKGLVVEALKSYITSGSIDVGDKSIKLRQNSYRVDADVVPAFVHKMWNNTPEYDGTYSIRAEGIGIYSNKERRRVYNWPAQDYTNGVSKNDNTSRMFKRIVRITKNLQCEMIDKGVISRPIQSFLIESLVWNAPSECFMSGRYSNSTRSVFAYLFNNLMRTKFNSDNWCEVNNIKYLFHSNQPWTREEAFNFVDKAWDYLGFN